MDSSVWRFAVILPSHSCFITFMGLRNLYSGLYAPFEDGDSILLSDHDTAEAEVRRVAPEDSKGYEALKALIEKGREGIDTQHSQTEHAETETEKGGDKT